MPRKIIIWDWNGTLLNDVEICVNCINQLLENRGLPLLNLQKYREVFTFPVKDYYEKLGFDFQTESFEYVANEFIDEYTKRMENAGLYHNTDEILRYFKKSGYDQFIVSAMEHKMLTMLVKEKGISFYFNDIIGIKDIYAKSKLNIADDLIKKLNTSFENIVFIGDTLHDHEIAMHFGFRSILMTHGHQSEKRLNQAGVLTQDNFLQLMPVVEKALN